MQLSSDTTRANQITPALNSIGPPGIASGGTIFGATWIRLHAIASPNAPPPNDSSALSVSSCRTRCAGVAPNEIRIAISRSRATARANNKLATFAQAISRINPTAPLSSRRRVRNVRLSRNSRKSSTLTVQPLSLSGYVFDNELAMVDISAAARARGALSRAITTRSRKSRSRVFSVTGTQMSLGRHLN